MAVVRITRIAVWLLLAAVAAGFAATWLVPDFFEELLTGADPARDVQAALLGVRLLMLIGVAIAMAIDRLLVSMQAIVSSAGDADPFVPANARRLQTVGWALLTLQLFDIACALLATVVPDMGSAAPGGEISVGGWIATLMVFVLAGAFAPGPTLRDELAGTI